MIELLLGSELRSLAQDVVIIALAMTAIVFGSGPERAAIAIWCACFELPSLVYQKWLGNDFWLMGPDAFLVAQDVTAGALWIALALYANRNYTLWMAGLQLLAMGSHVARGMVEAISPIAYAFLVIAPGWIQLLIMAAGFTRHIFRKREYGTYRDWRITARARVHDSFAPGSFK